jgi:hypothetical protein
MNNPPTNRAVVPLPPGTKERAYQLYCEGNTLPQIAAAVGASQSTVAKWSSKNNWKARKALVCTGGDNGSQPTDFSDLSLPQKQDHYNQHLENVALNFAEHAASLGGSQLVPVADKVKKLDEMARKALKMEPKPNCLIQIALLSAPAEKRARIDPALTLGN